MLNTQRWVGLLAARRLAPPRRCMGIDTDISSQSAPVASAPAERVQQAAAESSTIQGTAPSDPKASAKSWSVQGSVCARAN